MTRRFVRNTALAAVLAVAVLAGGYSLVATSAVAQAAGAPAKSGKTLKQVIKSDAVYATFEGGKLTGKEVMEFMNRMPPAMQEAPAELLPMIVNQMVNDKLVARAATAQKLDQDAETKQRIESAREQVIRERYVEKALDGKITDAKVKAKYNELIAKAPNVEEMHARHILVKDEATAKDIIAKLNKGGDFAALAKQYSTDPSKDQGGDLGYVTRDLMVKEFGDALFAMKKGQISKTPVKTQFGYHVIKAEDRRVKKKPTFEQVREQLQKQMTDEEIRNVVKSLREKNNVKVTVPQA